MKYPFEAALDEIEANPEPYIDAVFSNLESEFLVLPKGDDFLDYPQFERAYEMLKRATNGFGSNRSVSLAPDIRVYGRGPRSGLL